MAEFITPPIDDGAATPAYSPRSTAAPSPDPPPPVIQTLNEAFADADVLLDQIEQQILQLAIRYVNSPDLDDAIGHLTTTQAALHRAQAATTTYTLHYYRALTAEEVAP